MHRTHGAKSKKPFRTLSGKRVLLLQSCCGHLLDPFWVRLRSGIAGQTGPGYIRTAAGGAYIIYVRARFYIRIILQPYQARLQEQILQHAGLVWRKLWPAKIHMGSRCVFLRLKGFPPKKIAGLCLKPLQSVYIYNVQVFRMRACADDESEAFSGLKHNMWTKLH